MSSVPTSEWENAERGDIVETDDMLLFWHGWPSQWFPCKFVVDGVTYSCCEQYMMAEKARFFGDPETLAAIMATPSPREQKKLGRRVKNFDADRWDKASQEVVYRANFARFSQNPYHTKLLLGTGDKTLVEASPFDKVWGCGFRPDDPLALDKKNWKGRNLLGEALMRVRSSLRK